MMDECCTAVGPLERIADKIIDMTEMIFKFILSFQVTTVCMFIAFRFTTNRNAHIAFRMWAGLTAEIAGVVVGLLPAYILGSLPT